MSWSGVKQVVNIENIKSWCNEMHISNYVINPQGLIDVDGEVDLSHREFEELPYKFGSVLGYFDLGNCKNLKSLKNCPNTVDNSFDCSNCISLDLLVGCPKYVGENFWCMYCKREFTEEEVKSYCNVQRDIVNRFNIY